MSEPILCTMIYSSNSSNNHYRNCCNNNRIICSIDLNEVDTMQVDELEIDATVIKFFDDYIVENEIEAVKKNFEITAVDTIKRLIHAEKI